MTEVIDCKNIIETIKGGIKSGLAQGNAGLKPKASFVLVGDNVFSKRYVDLKMKACQEVGFEVEIINFSANVSEDALLETIVKLNSDSDVNGILVQMPLPEHINEYKIKNAIDKDKDVDGLSAENTFNIVFGKGGHIPCVPASILYILELYNVDFNNKTILIAGKSDITSKPLLNVFSNLDNADVIFCDHDSKRLAEFVKIADIIVSCCNLPGIIDSDWMSANSYVFDAGNTCIKDETKKIGYRVVGDVDLKETCKAKCITPVPGGLGPLSIAMLTKNIYNAFVSQI
ncbi:MAG: bifunctional 5,10-methylenetetrahydrofolate dehydrogenase/5,10-methenyltetrahydrofolate cyclohydrolase [Candidatus Riflebacteria bacterium]|nr:bifunctional 5,10-methylenetetrahydrofolate dehydrogenase/5,10-methenyltetrahydrofolate cyclohydrolase [Candidatus Riflebacteria bacterium]